MQYSHAFILLYALYLITDLVQQSSGSNGGGGDGGGGGAGAVVGGVIGGLILVIVVVAIVILICWCAYNLKSGVCVYINACIFNNCT